MLQPGDSITVQVTLSAAQLSQPGVYQASLTASDDTPYPYETLPITLTVDPPKGWAKLAGTVTGTTCAGATVPLIGATVSVVGQQQTSTLHTGTDGTYQIWLDARDGPVDVTGAEDSWAPAGQTGVKLNGGKTATVDLSLLPYPAC